MERELETAFDDWAAAGMPDGFEEQQAPKDTGRSAAFDVEFSVLGGKRRRPVVPVRLRGRRR